MPRPPGSRGVETRERILSAAQDLFTERGYDKTSLRDIADRLQITKAALYYYFPRKEDILIALHRSLHTVGSTVLAKLEAAPDSATLIELWPQLATEIIDFMVENRDLLLLHARNRNAFAGLELDDADQEDVEVRFARILASTDLPLTERVRMAAMIGVITEVFGESAAAFEDVPTAALAEEVRAAVADLVPAAGREVVARG